VFLFKKRATADVLAQKQQQLDSYISQCNNAVGLIVGTIDRLGVANESIEATIAEIEDYQAKLGATKVGLAETKLKNERIISNFKALVCAE
jgi:hypothetical protein